MKMRRYFSDKSNTLMPRDIGEDVLINEDSRLLRKHDLKRAVMLGSLYDQESNVEYIDRTGRNQSLIAKIIGLSEENVFLHNSRIIPIRKISKVVV